MKFEPIQTKIEYLRRISEEDVDFSTFIKGHLTGPLEIQVLDGNLHAGASWFVNGSGNYKDWHETRYMGINKITYCGYYGETFTMLYLLVCEQNTGLKYLSSIWSFDFSTLELKEITY